MTAYEKRLEIRWSDLDPNYHLRHSAYYDYGAFSRISYLNENGITPDLMLKHHLGPVLFREECLFKKEIRFGDDITINLRLEKANENMSRWTMLHELWKNNHQLAAVITVEGAWMDTSIRKLSKLPESFKAAFDRMPRTPGFEYR